MGGKAVIGLPNPYVLGGVGLAFALSLGFGAVQTGRLNHAKADLAATRTQLAQERARTAAEHDQRAKDAETAKGSYEALSSACVEASKRAAASGRVIQRVIYEPAKPSAPGAPVSDIIGADQLREVIAEPGRGPAGAPAEPVRRR